MGSLTIWPRDAVLQLPKARASSSRAQACAGQSTLAVWMRLDKGL